MPRHQAFISYSHRDTEWVGTLQRNLERCLAHLGREGTVFLDQTDLGAGHSWVAQLQAGLAQAERLILVVTPEALESPRVQNEYEAVLARRRDWQNGRLLLAILTPAPLPPFLEPIQYVDFSTARGETYRERLRELLGPLVGRTDRRNLPALPDDLELPEPPHRELDAALRSRLVDCLAPALASRSLRIAVATALDLGRKGLEGYLTEASAASAALVRYSGRDNEVEAALRVIAILEEELAEDLPDTLPKLAELRTEIDASRRRESERTPLLEVYLRQVASDHDRLVPYFQQRAELDLIDRVYVPLALRPELATSEAGTEAAKLEHSRRPLGLREVLELDPAEHPWVTGRWVVRGDPGAGKTTLLRHLASTLAREHADHRPVRWVPVFESLPRLLREREELLRRIARRLERAGHPAQGFAAALDREGQEGRLLLLFDGLDEVPREERTEAEKLLRDLATRWPSPIVVASRPVGYRRPGAEYRELDLLDLERESRRRFLAQWFGRRTATHDTARAEEALAYLESDRSLRELAGNPLYLTLMALIFEQQEEPRRNRARLYDQVFDLLLEGRHRAAEEPAPEPMPQKQAVYDVLRYLGYTLTEENRDAEPVESLEMRLYADDPEVERLRRPLERQPRWRSSLRPFLRDLADVTGILADHDGPEADWRFWHRTFREALAAERLARLDSEKDGRKRTLERAGGLEGDLSRWAEPYALLVGRVDDPDALVRSLLDANRDLGLRALATAQGLDEATIAHALELGDDWEERAGVYARLPELLGDGERALALLDRVRQATRNGNDLYFLAEAIRETARLYPDATEHAERLERRFFDHIPPPPPDLFTEVETRDGRVPLWCEIPAGSFLMGSAEGKGYDDEHPQHEVTISASFRLGAVPVTNRQYLAFDPEHPVEQWEGVAEPELAEHPVVNVSWFAAVAFCRWLAQATPDNEGARLPTETEWEYACRVGTATKYWSGDAEFDLERVGWYSENSGGRTHRVGRKEPSPWGLYDVHGNVDEWTATPWSDDYSEEALAEAAERDQQSSGLDPRGGSRVIRGGAFVDPAGFARSAVRGGGSPGYEVGGRGFRVLLPGPSLGRRS